MAESGNKRGAGYTRAREWKTALFCATLAILLTTSENAYATGGIAAMSSIPLSIADVMKEKPNSSNDAAANKGSLSLASAKSFKNALNDPLTKENAGQASTGKSLQAKEDASFKVAMTQGIDTLQTKALSLMAKLGEWESGKTHETRQAVNKEQPKSPFVSLDKAAGLAPATVPAPATPPVVPPAPSALPKPAAEHKNPVSQPAAKPEVGTKLPAIKPEVVTSQIRLPVNKQGQAINAPSSAPSASPSGLALTRPTPVAAPTAVATLTEERAPTLPAPEITSPAFLSAPSNVVRLPVQNELRNSVLLDIEAETRARQMLTEEVKQALLPVTGELSAIFESGKEGVAAIGYDRMGGTSYGKYQIASRTGMMQLFMKYLDEHEPSLSERLRKSGSSNTSSRWGGMPSEWKKIAAENPKRFEELQDKFIMQTNYQPAASNIEARTAMNVDGFSPALKEVLWSTAVQHGPNGAARIFANAADHTKEAVDNQNFDKRFIEEVYRVRKLNFQSSTPRVRNAVKSRLTIEQQMAITLLDEQGVKDVR